jgi:hypothetical protein
MNETHANDRWPARFAAANGDDRCGNDACARPAEPGDAYCAPCGLERSLFTRRGGERDSGAFERPGR